MKKILLLLLLCCCLCGCDNTEKEVSKMITSDEIKSIMINNEYVIIDVRTKEEYNEGHIKTSINIPYDEIDESINIDKNNIVFVYCKSGNRSKFAYDKLVSLGYRVYDLGAYNNIDLEKE